jgi:hypothetical protein
VRPNPSLVAPARSDFFRFAQNLQNAATFFQERSERPTHSAVAVLFLRWDMPQMAVHRAEKAALEAVLRGQLRWETEDWAIPITGDASPRLVARLASLFASRGADALCVVYYQGYSRVEAGDKVFLTW